MQILKKLSREHPEAKMLHILMNMILLSNDLRLSPEATTLCTVYFFFKSYSVFFISDSCRQNGFFPHSFGSVVSHVMLSFFNGVFADEVVKIISHGWQMLGTARMLFQSLLCFN